MLPLPIPNKARLTSLYLI